jgi:hypothetical protein
MKEYKIIETYALCDINRIKDALFTKVICEYKETDSPTCISPHNCSMKKGVVVRKRVEG